MKIGRVHERAQDKLISIATDRDATLILSPSELDSLDSVAKSLLTSIEQLVLIEPR